MLRLDVLFPFLNHHVFAWRLRGIMTTATSGDLDAEELLHLSLKAMEEDRDEDAISLLKRGIGLEPQNGTLHYLLGAMYAQIGMIDRAIGEMTLATRFSPTIHMAHFQLGLLHFTSGHLDPAAAAWEPLLALGPEHPLVLFRAGLLHLARDEFDDCAATIRHGLELNSEHASLNDDMRMVAEKAEEAARAQRNGAEAERDAAADNVGQHVLLSGYRQLDK
jgi:tetratricopeptide (TPR) repeat protein